MHKTFSVLALICCGLWSASQAKAASICAAIPHNLVSNCGFETGDFTSWTISGNTANPLGTYYGVDNLDASSGNYGAYMSQDYIDGGTAPVDLSQLLTTIPGDLYTVTFFLEQDTAPTLGYTHAFTATLGGTSVSLTPTTANPGPVGTFTEYAFSGTATAASTPLVFTFENDDNYWSLDDVSAVLAPEPSTYLLAGTAFSGLLLRRRRVRGTVTGDAP
jgi:hypothetical protein